jgi:hypothetical protein
MKINRSYDENDEMEAIVIKKQQKIHNCNKCFNIFEKIIVIIVCVLLFCMFEAYIYWIVDTFLKNHRDNTSGYEHLKTTRRRLHFTGWHHHYENPCLSHKYGCCEIYTGDYINNNISNVKTYTFEGYYSAIIKLDEKGTNCPSLLDLVKSHNMEYSNKDSCLKNNNTEKCCYIDIMVDQIKRDKDKFLNDTNYIYYYNKNRYKPLIDDNNNKYYYCPSIKQLMYEKSHNYPCNYRYTNCSSGFVTFVCICMICSLLCLIIQHCRYNCKHNCKKRKIYKQVSNNTKVHCSSV